MKLDHAIKITFVTMIGMLIITSTFIYHTYNNLCNNATDYSAVEILQSNQIYSVCGAKFGIVNTGQEQISVTKLVAITEDASSKSNLTDFSAEETTMVDSGQTIAVEAADEVYYLITSPLTSELEQSIQIRKF